MDLEQGQSRKLAQFLPSQKLSLLLAFFDQYSNSLWSPDSQSLVFADRIAPDAGDSDTTNGNRVFVMDVDDPSSITAIAKGSLAFWAGIRPSQMYTPSIEAQ